MILIYFECSSRVVCKWNCTHKYLHVSKGRKIKVKATAKKGRKRERTEHSVCCCGQKSTCIVNVLRLKLKSSCLQRPHPDESHSKMCLSNFSYHTQHSTSTSVSMWYNNKTYTRDSTPMWKFKVYSTKNNRNNNNNSINDNKEPTLKCSSVQFIKFIFHTTPYRYTRYTVIYNRL